MCQSLLNIGAYSQHNYTSYNSLVLYNHVQVYLLKESFDNKLSLKMHWVCVWLNFHDGKAGETVNLKCQPEAPEVSGLITEIFERKKVQHINKH
jgi:hypothetical protein